MNVSDIRFHQYSNTLDFTFEDGKTVCLSAVVLRQHSPSADKTPGSSDVRINGVEPVGNYAIRILFSDGHNTGLYTWPYLRALGEKGHTT